MQGQLCLPMVPPVTKAMQPTEARISRCTPCLSSCPLPAPEMGTLGVCRGKAGLLGVSQTRSVPKGQRWPSLPHTRPQQRKGRGHPHPLLTSSQPEPLFHPLHPLHSLVSSRFSPHMVAPAHPGLPTSGIPHPAIVSPIVKQEPAPPSLSPAVSA